MFQFFLLPSDVFQLSPPMNSLLWNEGGGGGGGGKDGDECFYKVCMKEQRMHDVPRAYNQRHRASGAIAAHG